MNQKKHGQPGVDAPKDMQAGNPSNMDVRVANNIGHKSRVDALDQVSNYTNKSHKSKYFTDPRVLRDDEENVFCR